LKESREKQGTLMTSREVAISLDLSPDMVNEFARRKLLRGFKEGRQWRFRKRDVHTFKRHLPALTG